MTGPAAFRVADLGGLLSSSMEERSKLEAEIEGMRLHIDQLQQRAAVASDHFRKDIDQLQQRAAAACDSIWQGRGQDPGDALMGRLNT